MEDLKDFTGAGLNLTLFNVLDAALIWQGIKDVWASPYTERSYQWRQRYLNEQANVFPSILIIPSINADFSGVMITKGVSSGKDDDITIAINRGVGGAVEGQASESWLLRPNGQNVLISPAREPEYMSIPSSGGVLKVATTYEGRLLNEKRLGLLREMAASVMKDLGALGIKGPYDMEMGFKDDKLWLFQVRPFVENKKAAASEYLGSISPTMDYAKLIPLNTRL
jgi:phosphoenolpyruvate synthase/pyruvate phosphate dikinase